MRRVLHRILGTVALLAGTAGLYYGFVMSFLVPGILGEPYFQRQRVLLGNIPLAVSVLALCGAGWLFFTSLREPRFTLGQTIACCIGGAAGLWVLLAIIGALIYQR
jgi:biotin transporter BioY